MARVNVEERAWLRFARLASAMGWKIREASGAMLGIWHESQEKFKTEATADELCFWAEVSPEERQRFLGALVMSDFITPRLLSTDQGELVEVFHIEGNAKQMLWMETQLAKSAKGVARRKELHTQRTYSANTTPGSTSGLPAGQPVGYPNTVQVNSKSSIGVNGNLQIDQSTQVSDGALALDAQDAPGESARDVPRGTSKSRKDRGAIEAFVFDPSLRELLRNVTHETQEAWFSGPWSCLGDQTQAWIETKLREALVYLGANPHKRRAGGKEGTFFTNWMIRGWNQEAGRTPGRSPQMNLSRSDRSVMHNMNLRKLVDEGKA